MKIETLSTQSVKPSSSTPPQLRDFKLSFIDERIPASYIPLILYYTFDEDSNISQSGMCDRLKRSLSDALVQFYPLAGRMKGQTSVDCNDDGVLYMEASADGHVLDIVESPQPEILDKLIPFVTNGYVSNVQEQLAVQVSLIFISLFHHFLGEKKMCILVFEERKYWRSSLQITSIIYCISI